VLRTYARIVGIGLALAGIAALVGVWGQSPFRIIFFLGTSLIFLYAGFGRLNKMEMCTIVGGMGILYLYSALLLIVIWDWFSTPDDSEMPKILLRVTIGVVSLLSARFLPQRDEERGHHAPEVQPYITEELATPEAQVSVEESLLEEDHTELLPDEEDNRDGAEGHS
jgi:hypothetical protein